MRQSDAGEDLLFVGAGRCNGGQCVEVARFADGRVAIRSNLAPDDDLCVVTADEWRNFLDAVKASRFDAV